MRSAKKAGDAAGRADMSRLAFHLLVSVVMNHVGRIPVRRYSQQTAHHVDKGWLNVRSAQDCATDGGKTDTGQCSKPKMVSSAMASGRSCRKKY